MTNKQKLENLGIQCSKINSTGKTVCPKCSHTRKKKNDPCLSVDVVTGVYNCHNDSCDFQGGVADTYQKSEKVYTVPKFTNTTDLNENKVNWIFQNRLLTPATIKEMKLTESIEWMPQTQKEEKVINFNYFRDGNLVNTKFRTIKKDFKMVKGAELIFYNLDSIKEATECVIVEGEFDCMAFVQSGVKNVVSVPNGASKSANANLEYLDNCIEYFDNKKRIILAMDDDEAGMSLRDELARRLGFERCYKVDFKGCKDANEFLIKNGELELKEIVSSENLKEYPISGIVTANEIWDEVELLFREGLARGLVTGEMPSFDELVSIVQGQLMVVTGIPNHGKSPFVLMVMSCLSKRYGWKWGMFTPEHKPLSIYIVKICELLLGKRVRKGIGFSESEKNSVKYFVNDHFLFIQPEEDDLSTDNILSKAKKLVQQKGIKGFMIDPWNKLEHKIGNGDTEHNYISKELDKIIIFLQRNLVFGIIVVHPKKMMRDKKTGQFDVPSLYDISGSSNWFNKPDIGLIVYRNFITKCTEIHVEKMKYEHLGAQGKVELQFNMNNSRYIPRSAPWDNSNWLIQTVQSDLFEEPIPINEVPDFVPNLGIEIDLVKIDTKIDESELPF